jgi:hypothetical protein
MRQRIQRVRAHHHELYRRPNALPHHDAADRKGASHQLLLSPWFLPFRTNHWLLQHAAEWTEGRLIFNMVPMASFRFAAMLTFRFAEVMARLLVIWVLVALGHYALALLMLLGVWCSSLSSSQPPLATNRHC